MLFSLHGLSQVTCNLGLSAIPVNPSCSNACNGSVILTPFGGTAPYSFNAFDHNFPGSSLDLSILEVRNGNFTVNNNQLVASSNIAVITEYDNSIATKQVFPDNGKVVVEGSFFVDYNSYVNFGLTENAVINNQDQFPFAFFFNYGRIYLINEGNWTDAGPYSASTWYDIKIEKLGNTVNYYIRNTGVSSYTLVGSKTTQTTAPGYKLGASYYNYYNYNGGFISKNWRVGGNPPTEGLCPGTYTYTAYDVNGCFATATVTLGVDAGPTSLKLAGTIEPATCNTANNGSIDLVPSGGVGPYTFDFGHVFSGGSINTNIFELRNGNFSQTSDLRQGINYNNNNSWDNSISTKQSFSDGGFLQMDASFKFDANADVIFGFANTGVIDDYQDVFFGFRVSNGSSLFAYTKAQGLIPIGSLATNTWLDFRVKRTGNIVEFYTSVHGSGVYTLKHTSVFNTPNIEYKAAALNFANYYASAGGYNTKGWNVQVTPKTDHLAPGTYTYTITDANGCTATSMFNVGTGGGNGVTLTANLVNGTIAGTATGAVSLTPAGGTSPYSYQLTPDFTGNTIDPVVFNLRNGSFTQSNGSLRGNTAQVANYDHTVFTKASFTDASKLSFSASFSFANNANLYFGFTDNADLTNQTQVKIGYYIMGQQLMARVGSNNYNITTITSNTWYDLKIEKTNSVVRFFLRLNGQPEYNQVYLASYTGATEYKAGLAMYGTSGGFYTNNWNINCNPPLTNLAAGNYTYRVYDANGCYAIASVPVPVSSTMILTGQGINSSAWNVNDGSVSLSSNPSNNFSIYSRVFNSSFTGSQLNTDSFTVRNGAFSQNNGLFSGTNVNNTGWDNSVITNKSFSNNGSIAVEMDMNFEAGTQSYFGFAPANSTITSYNTLPFAFSYQSGNLYAYSAATGNILLGSIASNQWHSFRIERAGNEVKFYLKPSPDALYQEIYSMTTTAPIADYKVGVVNFFSNQPGNSRGYNSKNWKVFTEPVTNGLATGIYSYVLINQANIIAATDVAVGTDISLVQSMTVPANVVVNTDLDANTATGVVLGNPTFDGPSAGIVITNDAPAVFPLGNTTVTWTAKQGANTITGTQIVTVEDKQAPKVTPPADVTVTIYSGQTVTTGISLGTATAIDNVTQNVALTNNAPVQYNVGTTAVTWYGVDAAGNIGTAVQTVTVISVNLPVITAPANVTTTTEPGKNYRSKSLINMGAPSIGVPVPGISISNNAPNHFPIGTTAVKWTISLGADIVEMIQYITITDDENPILNVPANLTTSTDVTSAVATNVNLGTATATDNSGNVTISNNAPTQFPIGNTTVTWTATDAAGNTVTKTQIVTVKDLVAPSIIAPADITVNTDTNKDFATIPSIGNATSADNVAVISVTNNAPANAQYSIGVTVITWTAKDAAGNSATATQKITVVDNQLPTISAPADVTITISASQTNASNVQLGLPVYSDNVSGATITNNAPASFPIGTTIVTWTVTDVSGNTATATQTIIVEQLSCPPLSASILENTEACGVELTGMGGAEYKWIFGGNVIEETATIQLGSTSANGIYTLIVSDDYCNTADTATYHFTFSGAATNTTAPAGSYTIIALKSARFGETNQIQNGGVAVKAYNGEAAFKKNSSVDGEVKAKYISTQNPVNIVSKVYAMSNVALPAMQYYSGNCNYYSNYTVNYNTTVTLNNNYRDLYIKKGSYVTLNGSIFGNVIVEEGSTVKFNATTLNIESLIVGKGLSGIATAKFANNSSVRVKTQVKVEEGNIVNPEENKVTFYLGDNNCDEEKFLVKGNGSRVNADIYIPNGKLMVQSNCGHGYGCSSDGNGWIDYILGFLTGYYGSNNSSSSNANCATAYMKGVFIAEEIESGNSVVWTGTAAGSTESNECVTLIVKDNKAPLIDCVPNQQFCETAIGNYTLPTLSASDNSGIYTISFQATGATSRSGNGNDASGVFKKGVTTILWTVKDANGNQATCTTLVNVTGGPSADISTSSSDVFCGELTLTASCSSTGVTYGWLYNNNIVGTGSTLSLNSNSPQGIYSLTATDANGCSTSNAASYNYNYENQLSRYTIVGIQKVSLHEANNVQSGSVGVLSYCGEADFKKDCSVNGYGSFVKAKNIYVQNSSVIIPNKIYSPAVIGLPVMQTYNGSYSSNDYTVPQNATVTLSGNYRTLTVRKGSTVTLSGSTFRKISIEEGAKVTFTSNTLNIEDLYVGKGPNNGYTKVHFANNTSIRISKQVKVDDNCQINPDGSRVTFYIGDTQCDEEKFFVKGNRTSVTANVYAPNGTIHVTGGNLSQCYMTGIFIAERVLSEGKGVIWNGFNCNTTFARPGSTTNQIVQAPDAGIVELNILATPNPSTDFFTIKMKSSSVESVNLRVTDISGRPVEVISNQEANTIFRLGDKWPTGLYMLEVMQGTAKKTVKLLKR